jgi:Cu+-exporting ATPase
VQVDPEQKHYHSLITKTIIAAIVAVPIFILSMFNLLPSLQTPAGFWSHLCLGIITLVTLIYSGGNIYTSAWQAFKKHHANMDTLIAVGTAMAWLYSMIIIFFTRFFPQNVQHVYFETAIVIIALINLGSVLELRARRHTSEAIQKLLHLQPKTAHVLKNNEEIEVPIAELKLDDFVRVHPGEQIPVDGIVTQGNSTVDESMLTGEALASQKNMNDKVFAGTLNKTGSFIFKATHVGKDTVLAQIIKLVEQAQGSKPPLARIADQISAIFVPAVLIVSVATALIWFHTDMQPKAIYMLVTAMAVLIIACPCALGLAVPISVMVGIGKAAEYGVLIRHADALQQARKLTTIVLDKTGTVTQGKPQVTGVYCDQLAEKELLSLVASLEIAAEHSLAEAIVKYAKTKNVEIKTVENFQAISGLGVKGKIDQNIVLLGNKKFMQENQISFQAWIDKEKVLQERAQTLIYVAENQEALGIITIADPVKPDSKSAIAHLKSQGLKVVLLTGDHSLTAKKIAEEVGIEEVIADVLPQQKAEKIMQLQALGEIVGMVGDGINDAPALARADLGFAMSSGTDVAIESAAITLMRSSLIGVLDAMLISKQTVKNMQQNLFGAFIYNIIGIPIAAGILFPITATLLNPMIAGIAMALSSVTVVSNANRLRWFKIKRIENS